MSVRADILFNLATALKGISIDNGYSTDIAEVYPRPFTAEEIKNSPSPAISIIDGPEEQAGNVAAYRRIRSGILLEGIIRQGPTSPGGPTLSEDYNMFIADLRECLHAANLGDNVIYHRLLDLTPVFAETWAYFTYTLQIVYYYPEASP